MTRPITIEPVLNGFVVQVGCQRVVFTNLESLCENIHRYYKDPSGVEKQFVRDGINKTMDGPVNPAAIRSESDCCGTEAPQCEPPRGAPLRR